MTMTAKQTMTTDLIVVHFMDTLEMSFERMKKARVRHLPVVDDEGKIVGVISDRDFKRAQWPVESPGDDYRLQKPIFKPSSTVGDYMSSPVTWVEYDTNLIDVAKKMVEQKISSVLIHNGAKMIGIVTHEDLLRVLISLLNPPATRTELLSRWAYHSPIGKIATALSEIGL